MGNKSAEQNIIDYLRERYEWHSAAQLQRQLFQNKNGTYASPKAISRRLQENAEGENAILEVKYDGPAHSAFYRIKQNHRKIKYQYIDLPDGSKKEVAVYA